jgi:cytidylate kinase
MAVITISRESGARGTLIGQTLAQRLGYRFVDREIIHEVALEYGVRQDEFERIYEQAPGLLERYDRRNREIVQLIGRILQGLARRDNTVIVARDAFAVLRDLGDTLNVRVTARRSQRIQRIQADEDLTVQYAKAMLDRLDGERSKYIGAYYGLDWASAGLYDLAINTSKLSPMVAVDLIASALNELPQETGLRVSGIEADTILDRAIDEAFSLLDATTGQ